MSDEGTVPLTLIVPVFDRQAGLDRALASVAAQTLRPESVIVVDDGSVVPARLDAAILAGLDTRLLRHPRNLGAAAARNTGLRQAHTQWVSFLDSDDRLFPDSIEARWRDVLQRLPAGGGKRTIFGCGWCDVDSSGRPLALRWPRPGTAPRDFASGCWFSPGSCVILDRGAALEAAGFQDEMLRRFEDLDWFLTLALEDFVFEPQPLVAVVVERGRQRPPALIEAMARAMREKWSAHADDASVRRRLDAYLWLEVAAAHHFAGAPLRTARALAASLLRLPRLSLQFSPGWTVEPLSRVPERTVYWPA